MPSGLAQCDPNRSLVSRQSWLYRERRKRRRSIICGFVIFFAVVFAVIAGLVIWWLAKNNWLQPGPDATS